MINTLLLPLGRGAVRDGINVLIHFFVYNGAEFSAMSFLSRLIELSRLAFGFEIN